MRVALFAVPAVLAVLASPATAQRHDGHQRQATGEKLGTITFPTSGAKAAQADFIRGTLLLHSFEYQDALEAFRKAQAKDPAFAMAFWGEAMTWNHPLWNEQWPDSARAALASLAARPPAKGRTDKERAWLASVEVLYGGGAKPRRDTLYSQALADMLRRWPDDDEIRTFYALSLMGLSQATRNVPAYMRAGAIATEVMQRKPDHPGAAHYVIHAFDDPVHAPLGEEAAHAYSTIAPGADHAQHMTTHIFLALGQWEPTVSQNTIAAGPDSSTWQAGHYTYWLHYGLLQQGRSSDAVALLDQLHAHLPAQASPGRRAYLTAARAQQVINLARWDDPSLAWEISLAGAGSVPAAVNDFALGYAALRRGDAASADSAVARIEAAQGQPTGPLGGSPDLPALLARQLRAASLRHGGQKVEATTQLRAIADGSAQLPMEFGPPDFVKPPYELLGEWLLEDGDAAGAQVAFSRALELMPGRLVSLRGLAASARKAGDQATAERAEREMASSR
jgi:tetratricopeptide (TPR) repeat protein